MRGDEPSPTRSAVLVRLQHSHLRFGSFQRHAHLGHTDRVRRLAEHCIGSYYPALADDPEPIRALYGEIARRTVALVGSWMAAGFVHGVLNTDNMNVTGESFDYGPWRWLPSYDPMFTAAYFDHGSLYSFGRQPEAAVWNLQRLAETFEDVVDVAVLVQDLREGFHRWLQAAVLERVLDRLGVTPRGAETDTALVDAWYVFMSRTKAGYDQAFFDWYGGPASEGRAASSPAARTYEDPSFGPVRGMIMEYEPTPTARHAVAQRPYFQAERPQSMLIDEVEALWSAIDERDDWAPLHAKVQAVRAMGRAYGRRSPPDTLERVA